MQGNTYHLVNCVLTTMCLYLTGLMLSYSAWLHDWEHEMIGKVSTKVRYLSNLTLDTAEELQVRAFLCYASLTRSARVTNSVCRGHKPGH